MRYFRVKIQNNLIKNENGDVAEAGFIYPSCWDAHKLNVRAYKGKDGGGAEYCICETDNKEMADALAADKNVTELTEVVAEEDISTIRAKPDIKVEVRQTAIDKSSTIKTDIENLLKLKGLKYDIV